MQNSGTRALFVMIAILIVVIAAHVRHFSLAGMAKALTNQPFPVSRHWLRLFSWPSPSSRRLACSSNRFAAGSRYSSDLGAVEVQVGTRRRGAALVLVPGAVDGGAVWVLRGGTRAEQAELADLHSWP
jgi:hypothetical protein